MSCHGDGLIKQQAQLALMLLWFQGVGGWGEGAADLVGMESENRVAPGERGRSWVCRAVGMALGALREEGVMGEEIPLLPALWEGRVSAWCSLVVSGTSNF